MRVRAFILLILSVISFAAGEVQFDLNSYEPIEYSKWNIAISPNIKSNMQYDSITNHGVVSIPLTYYEQNQLQDRSLLFLNNFSLQFYNFEANSDQNIRLLSLFMLNQVTYSHRRYRTPKELFFQMTPSMKLNLFKSKTYDEDYNTQTENDIIEDLEASLELTIGKGTITDVTYPAVCMQVFNLLEQENALSNKSTQTIIETSQLFERLKKEKFFDRRNKRIKNIKKITDHLYSKNTTSVLSPEQLMKLLDYWEYGFHQKRFHGTEFQFGTRAKIDNILNRVTDDERSLTLMDSTYNTYLNLFTSFEIHRTPNLKRTKSLFIELGAKETVEDEDDYWSEYDDYSIAISPYLEVFPSISFYPTLRSSITLSNSAYYSVFEYHLQNVFTTNLEYYITPQLTMSGNCDLILKPFGDDIFKSVISFDLTVQL